MSGEAASDGATPAAESDGELSCGAPLEQLHRLERLREKLPAGSWRRRLYDRFFLPLGPPTQFKGSRTELIASLGPHEKQGEPNENEERAKEILEEAQAIYDAADARIEGAHSRATTLQGAVAIATSLVLAGGALLADPSKVRGDGWRLAFAVGLLAVVFCLVMAGARSLAATSRIHVFHRPTASDITRRSKLPLMQARIELAAETLRNYACNTKVADWKVAYLGAAAWWFRFALLALLLLALLLAVYGVSGPTTPVSQTQGLRHAPNGQASWYLSDSRRKRRRGAASLKRHVWAWRTKGHRGTRARRAPLPPPRESDTAATSPRSANTLARPLFQPRATD